VEWFNLANRLAEQTALSTREAQIIVLDSKGNSNQEIHNAIKNVEGEAPSPNSIPSIRTRVKNRWRDALLTSQVANPTYSSITPIPRLPGETENPDPTLHVYLGDIGTGKSVTSGSHIQRLSSKEIIDHAIVVDPLEDRPSSAIAEIQHGHRITTDDVEECTTQLESHLDGLPNDDFVVILFDHFQHFLREAPTLLEELLEREQNLSLRVVTSSIHIIPDTVKPDIYHIHHLKSEEATTRVWNELTENSPYDTKVHAVNTLDPRTIAPILNSAINDRPPEILQVVPQTLEVDLSLNLLSNVEKEALTK